MTSRLIGSASLHINDRGRAACACNSAKQYFNSDCCLRTTVETEDAGAIADRLGDASPGRFISEPIRRQIQSLQCSTEPRRNTAPQHRALTQIRDEEGFSSSLSLFRTKAHPALRYMPPFHSFVHFHHFLLFLCFGFFEIKSLWWIRMLSGV